MAGRIGYVEPCHDDCDMSCCNPEKRIGAIVKRAWKKYINKPKPAPPVDRRGAIAATKAKNGS
jgi:hypothetical protein